MLESIITTAEAIRLAVAVAIVSSIASVVIVYRVTRNFYEVMQELARIVRSIANGK